MVSMLFRWMALTVAVWVAASIVPGVTYDRWQDVMVAALVLGILNALLKPLLQLVTLSVIIVTLGLFLFVINALLVVLTDRLVPGFHVAGFWSAVGASLVISVVSIFLGYSGRRPRRVAVNRPPPPRTPAGPPPGKGPIIDV